jgi:hypothetical protein
VPADFLNPDSNRRRLQLVVSVRHSSLALSP